MMKICHGEQQNLANWPMEFWGKFAAENAGFCCLSITVKSVRFVLQTVVLMKDNNMYSH